ncbi:MAG: homocysteine S-methyltransferase family protein [Planctomycetota bacterium]
MTAGFLAALERGPLLADGGFGSELFKQGLPPGAVPETWNTDHPDRVRAVHQSYIDAGSRMILTNSFGGNPLKLAAAGLEGRLDELNRAAVTLLKSPPAPGIFIAGDMGPTGDFLEPVGTLTESACVEGYRRQAAVLAAAGADALIIETMADLGEITAAIRGARAACDLPVIASMTFEQDAGGGGFHTMMGVTPGAFAEAAEKAGAAVIGTNCGRGAHETAGVAAELRRLTGRPIIAKPNAGVPRVVNGRTVYDQSPEFMLPWYTRMLDAGVTILGGCCGTTPEHIAALARLIAGRTTPLKRG